MACFRCGGPAATGNLCVRCGSEMTPDEYQHYLERGLGHSLNEDPGPALLLKIIEERAAEIGRLSAEVARLSVDERIVAPPSQPTIVGDGGKDKPAWAGKLKRQADGAYWYEHHTKEVKGDDHS